jgi:hypothetical protein
MTEKFEDAARAWCDGQLNKHTQLRGAIGCRLVLGCTVFGDMHVDRFLRFCLPSLQTQGALEDGETLLLIHTDLAHFHLLKTHLSGQFSVYGIPADVMDAATPADRFALVAAATAVQIAEARALGAAFHMLVPDHVYAWDFFRNLMRLGEKHPVILGGGLSAHVAGIGPKLEAADGKVDGRVLTGWAMEALHPQFLALIRNGRNDYPLSTLHLYVSPTSACIVSPHMAPLWLSHEVLKDAKINPLIAIDGQLPDIVGEREHYVPTPEDGLTYIEVSGDEKPHNSPDMRWSPWDYCVEFYRLTNRDKRWLKFLKTPTWVRFSAGCAPGPLMPESEIEAAVEASFKAVSDGYQMPVQVYDPTDVLEPPYLGAMFFDADSNAFYQARGMTPADWRFVPPSDLVGGFWKVFDFFVGAPPNDPRGPTAATRHNDAQLVRDTMDLNGVHILDFGGLCWDTADGTKVYLVKLKIKRTHGFKLFAGFASEKPNPARPVGGLGFHFEDGLLSFGSEIQRVGRDEFIGLRIEVTTTDVSAFINDRDFVGCARPPDAPLAWPAVAMFEVADGPRPTVLGYDRAVNRHMNGTYND